MRIGDWIADWHLAIAQYGQCQLRLLIGFGIASKDMSEQYTTPVTREASAVDISRKLYTLLDGAGGA